MTEALSFSPQAQVGYYDQALNEVSDRDGQTLLDFLRRSTEVQEPVLRNGLINAGFPYVDHERRLSVLSGGERARLMFLALRLNRPNFLVMDEPTNHIDIDGREELEAQLAESGATLLMTSHDRRFIDNVANRFVEVSDGVLREVRDPEAFYAAVAATGSDAESVPETEVERPQPATFTADEEALLMRIVELEELLSADRARKLRFQKPDRQAEWAAELARLNERLDRV